MDKSGSLESKFLNRIGNLGEKSIDESDHVDSELDERDSIKKEREKIKGSVTATPYNQ